jgi:VanZ family protein
MWAVMSSARRLSILRLTFWSAAVFAFVMAIVPHPPELPGAPSDKIQHIMAFLVLAGLAASAYPRSSPLMLGVGLSLFGALIELVQYIPSLHRDSDPADWIADTIAAVLVLLIIDRLRARRRKAIADQG